MRQRQTIVTKIAEPFPVLFGHVNHVEGRGPFFAANSEFHTPYSEKNLAWKEGAANGLRERGYTVTVEVRTY